MGTTTPQGTQGTQGAAQVQGTPPVQATAPAAPVQAKAPAKALHPNPHVAKVLAYVAANGAKAATATSAAALCRMAGLGNGTKGTASYKAHYAYREYLRSSGDRVQGTGAGTWVPKARKVATAKAAKLAAKQAKGTAAK